MRMPRPGATGLNFFELPVPNDPNVAPEEQYDARIAEYSQHVQLDDKGRPLFFVIDGYVYDAAGYQIGTAFGVGDGCAYRGISEVVVFPVPGRCGSWYIISSETGAPTERYLLAYSVLDMTRPNPDFATDPNRRGRFLTIPDMLTEGFSASQPWIDDNASPSDRMMPLNSINHDPIPFDDADGKTWASHMDAVDNPATGRAFLFFTTGWYTCTFEIAADGIHWIATLPSYNGPPSSFQYSRTVKGEAEAISIGSEVRYAFTHFYDNDDLWTSDPVTDFLTVRYHRFDAATPTFDLLSYDLYHTVVVDDPQPENVFGDPLVKFRLSGIEFSPNGQYIYYLMPQLPGGPAGFGYIDLNDDSFNNIAFDELAFVDAELELGIAPDGVTPAIYTTGRTALGVYVLGCFTGADDPSTGTWDPQLALLGTLAEASEAPASDLYYLMQSQPGNDPTEAMWADPGCCDAVFAMTARYGFASLMGNWTWEADDNPFNDLDVVRIADELKIPTGSHITAHDMTFIFGPEARLLIEPGAKFIATNCTFTGACDGRWLGIEALGTYDQPQLPLHQAQVTLNYCLVEQAEIGTLAGKRLLRTINSGIAPKLGPGAIIRASNTTYRDCRQGIVYRPYQNFQQSDPTVKLHNLGRFNHCTFTVDNAYRGTWEFMEHANLCQVSGIWFRDCRFENTLTDTEADALGGSVKLGYGIHSLDADYRVVAGCASIPPYPFPCPTADLERSSFEGLDHGIHALTSTSLRGFQVDQSDFVNNICGVYAANVVGARITRNHFTLGKRAVVMSNPDEFYWYGLHRGIFHTGGHGFTIDDNVMVPDPALTSLPALAEGIVVGYNRDNNDFVFRNDVSDMLDAYVGEGICSDINQKWLAGLQFICNLNTTNEYDLWNRVIDLADPTEYEDHTIRTRQGWAQRPAANTFDRNTALPVESDLRYNGQYNQVKYFYHDPLSSYEPEDFNPVDFQRIEVFTPPSPLCDSKLNELGIPDFPDPEVVLSALDHANGAKLAYGNTRYLYDQLIDGGSTDAVVLEITSTWPQDAWNLRDYLLGLSPFVSYSALKQMVEENNLPPAMVAEVCAANPEATQQNGFIAWMQQESGHPLPQYMVDMILASWNQQNYRGALEAQLAGQHARMTQMLHLALNTIVKDSVAEHTDSLRAVWNLLPTKAARYAEALAHLQLADHGPVEALMLDLPNDHELLPSEAAEATRLIAYNSLLATVYADGRTEVELDSTEVAALVDLIDEANDRPAWWAQNLLCFGYGICRSPITGGQGQERSLIHGPVGSAMIDEQFLRSYPNPASHWVALDHKFQGPSQSARLLIRDATGREVVTLPLGRSEAQTIWDCRSVQPGAYTVELINDGRTLATATLIIRP